MGFTLGLPLLLIGVTGFYWLSKTTRDFWRRKR
jgi:hypothetical protein